MTEAFGEGYVVGSPRNYLRLEGLAIAMASFFLFWRLTSQMHWLDPGWRAVIIFFIPDLSLFMYLLGPRLGSVAYNISHSYACALALMALQYASGQYVSITLTLLWTAHIGLDRFLNLGLKYPVSFYETHLGRIRSFNFASGKNSAGSH